VGVVVLLLFAFIRPLRNASRPAMSPTTAGCDTADVAGRLLRLGSVAFSALGKLVDLRLVHEQEERVEPAVYLLVAAVEAAPWRSPALQVGEPIVATLCRSSM